MSFTGLNWQTWTLRLGAGQNQKSDERALDAPELAKAIDVQFEELGGLQTRYPFADFTSGGTLADIRRVVENGDELLVFTKDTLYSWNAQLSKWVQKGTHLAVKLDETSRFVTTGDQVACDRAELDNVVAYAWADGTSVWFATIDKSTGSVLIAPQEFGLAERPRLVALDSVILLLMHDTLNSALVVFSIDPSNPSEILNGGSATTVVAGPDFNDYYDVVRVPGADQAAFAARRAVTTSYEVGTIDASLTVTSVTKARTCDGPVAVSCPPTGTQVQVVRTSAANVQGDLLTISTLADVYTAQAIGTIATPFAMNQIAAAHRSVADGGQYRCYVFWSSEHTTGTADFQSRSNWVDTGNTLGGEATFVRRVGVASRAFDHEGRVYVWLAFSGESTFSGANYTGFRAQLQNSYFLYRDDAFLASRAAFQRAGGFPSSSGHLPGVASIAAGQYAWCGVVRRVVALGPEQSGYAARAPLDIAVTFDSNEARRCTRLGETLYIACGEGVLQYDGSQLVEVGFHIYPWSFGAIEVPAGNVADGTYAIKNTLRWESARGEVDRSTTATTGTITIAAGPNGIEIPSWSPLYVTHKSGIAVEVWRTAVNPTTDAPFYLVSSNDPTDATNPNRYIANTPTTDSLATFDDELADTSLTSRESSPENGGVLENLAPPAATIILASDTRLFLAGVAGDPDRVWYSKQRNAGEVAAFHDALTVNIPAEGGAITALAFAYESPIVFRERAIYVLLGDGFDNGGGGQNYVAKKVPGNVGAVSAEGVAVTDRGVVFKSRKGWQVLNGAFATSYIGGAFADYDDEEVLAISAMDGQNQVRALTANRMLVFDTLVEPWRCAEWTISDGVHACMWNGVHVYASSSAVKQQQSSFAGAVGYGMVLELPWLKFADMQGFTKIDQCQVLGEYRSAHRLKIECARDYWKDGEGVYFQSKTWTVSPTTVGAREKVKHAPSIKGVEALKLRISVLDAAEPAGPSTGEAVKLTAISFELGFERGLNRSVPAAQRQ